MFRIALRSHIGGVLGWGGFMTVFAVIEASSFTRMAGSTSDGREQMAAGLAAIAQQISYLLPNPEQLNTLGGYVGWFLFGYVPLFFGVWAVIAGTGASRGEEERGLADQWLASGCPRWRLIAIRVGAFAVACAGAIAMPMALVAAIAAATGEPLNYGGMVLQGVPGLLTSIVCFSAGLLAGQLISTRRNAMAAAMITVIGLYLLNGFSREASQLRPYRWISPFAYSDRSNPIVTGGHLDIPSLLVIAGMALAVGVLATWAFSQRDLGSTVFGPGHAGHVPQRHADTNPIMRVPVLLYLWDQRLGIVTWAAAISLYAGMNISLVRPFISFFKSQGSQSTLALQARLSFGAGASDPYAGFIGAAWFPVVCILLGAFAITQVARWASDDGEGRLEMTLSAPVARWRVIADRAVSMIVAAVILIAVDAVAVYIAAQYQQVDLDPARVIAASILLLPVALAFSGAGAAIAAVRPRVAMVGLSALLLVSYMINFMAVPVFAPHLPPDWFLNLSVFKLYGDPLVDGANWPGFWVLVAIIAIGFGAALAAMQRREVGR